ncbi:hypothetical protein OEA_13150 [Priestia megaterium NCT-2]|uniref:hypothetical protein n=1 Tax=Priestia megaterium TaxID=1404 RepID=UPI000EB6A5F4|nr:hypothetical protein [Priestia megaterium]AYE50686.1 hypothetical protein OEA_13150 [Priestia megaterium NCT-2]
MEYGIFERLDVVKEYGNKDQIKHFEKYGKWKSKTVEKAFQKTLDEIFGEGNWEIVKEARKSMYKLGAKLEKRELRKDNRLSNGAWNIAYTKNLDTMIVAALGVGLRKETAQTLSNWAVDFRLITVEQHEILASRYNDSLREAYIKNSLENNVINQGEGRVLDDYASFVKELIEQLAGTLNRLEKLGIVEVAKIYNGYTSEDRVIEIHFSTYKKALDIKRRLQAHYGVTDWYLATYKNAKKSVEYNKEFAEQLAMVTDENGQVLELTNYFTTYAITLKTGKERILKYLKTYNREAIKMYEDDNEKFLNANKREFKEKRIAHIESETQKKVDNFLKPRVCKNDLHEIFGGKPKRHIPTSEDYSYDEKYYQLYFNNMLVERMTDLEELYGYKFN